MLNNDEKRIIRIKELESNCIEEMIIILKNTTKTIDRARMNYRFVNDDDNFIVREAEIILEDYINGSITSDENNDLQQECPKFKIDLNKLLNYLLILSIIVIGCVLFNNIGK